MIDRDTVIAIWDTGGSAIRNLDYAGVFVNRCNKKSTRRYSLSRGGAKPKVNGRADFDPLASVFPAGVSGLEFYAGTLLSGGIASG